MSVTIGHSTLSGPTRLSVIPLAGFAMDSPHFSSIGSIPICPRWCQTKLRPTKQTVKGKHELNTKLDDDFRVEPFLRIAGALCLSAIVVAVFFGADRLFAVGIGAVVIFGGGAILSCIAGFALWVCVGKARLAAIFDRTGPLPWLAAYLIFSAGSGAYFYVLS
jgi:hypothetical protein